MTKTAKSILRNLSNTVEWCVEPQLLSRATIDRQREDAALDQALKELEAIIGQAEPGTWVDPDDTDDLEWQGYVKGVQDYKDNLRQALYGKDEK